MIYYIYIISIQYVLFIICLLELENFLEKIVIVSNKLSLCHVK